MVSAVIHRLITALLVALSVVLLLLAAVGSASNITPMNESPYPDGIGWFDDAWIDSISAPSHYVGDAMLVVNTTTQTFNSTVTTQDLLWYKNASFWNGTYRWELDLNLLNDPTWDAYLFFGSLEQNTGNVGTGNKYYLYIDNASSGKETVIVKKRIGGTSSILIGEIFIPNHKKGIQNFTIIWEPSLLPGGKSIQFYMNGSFIGSSTDTALNTTGWAGVGVENAATGVRYDNLSFAFRPAPHAYFTSDVITGAAPLTVQFTDQSNTTRYGYASTATGWIWNATNVTGNNTPVTIATTQSPSFTFTQPGNYSIQLNSSNQYGFNLSTEVRFINVTETGAPAAPILPGDISAPIGFEWNLTSSDPALRRINITNTTITVANFDASPIWGNISRCTFNITNKNVTFGTTRRGDGLDLDGPDPVMVRIPAFYIKSDFNATSQFYRYWISPSPYDGFDLHPMFVQRNGTARSAVYVGAYHSALAINTSAGGLAGNATGTNLYATSISGVQPWTGRQMRVLGFDTGSTEISIGANISGATSGNYFLVHDIVVLGGSWAGGDAKGKLYLRRPAADVSLDNLSLIDDENLVVSGGTVAKAATEYGNISIVLQQADAAGYAAKTGNWTGIGQFGVINIWTISGIEALYLTERGNWYSQSLSYGIGSGISKTSSAIAGWNGEITGFDNSDTNIALNGTGNGTGTDGYTPVVWRGIENIWGNAVTHVAGYNSVDTGIRLVNRDGSGIPAETLTAGNYETTDAAPLGWDGYVYGYATNITYEDLTEYAFIPNKVTGGSSSTYITDYFVSHTPGTTRSLLYGGDYYDNTYCGIGDFLSVTTPYSGRSTSFRLEYIGEILTGTTAPPVSSFTMDGGAGSITDTAPVAVNFDDTSTGVPTSWNWTCSNITPGNNTKLSFSTVEEPVFVFTQPGNYSVQLNVSNNFGFNESPPNIRWVNVTAAGGAPTPTPTPGPTNLTANFNANITQGMAVLPVNFTDDSGASLEHIDTWNWTFRDADGDVLFNGSEEAANPTYNYSHTGEWDVTLTIHNFTYDDVGTLTRTKYIRVWPYNVSTQGRMYWFEDTFVPFWLWMGIIFAGVGFFLAAVHLQVMVPVWGMLAFGSWLFSAIASPVVAFFDYKLITVTDAALGEAYYMQPIVHQVTQPWVAWLLYGFAMIGLLVTVAGIVANMQRTAQQKAIEDDDLGI